MPKLPHQDRLVDEIILHDQDMRLSSLDNAVLAIGSLSRQGPHAGYFRLCCTLLCLASTSGDEEAERAPFPVLACHFDSPTHYGQNQCEGHEAYVSSLSSVISAQKESQ